DVCIPILEKNSNMVCGKDFYVGYSPERINPGDKVHKLSNIIKVVSGINEEVTNNIAALYELIIDAGVHKVSNIKVNFKGNTPKEILNTKYKEYNLFFLPTLGENFGHSIIEAIQNHIPVLISDNTPWMEFEDKKVGFNYSLNNEEYFESCLM